MDPVFEYFGIIVNRLQNPLPKGEYGERHHIYPRSCGGWDLKCNIVKLTPEEHYRCHELLPCIFEEGEDHRRMIYAWHILSGCLKLTSEDFGKLRKEYSAICSQHLKEQGVKPPSRKGVKLSVETRKRLSESHKGKIPTNAWKKGAIPWNKGKKGCFSAEARKRMSESQKKRGQTK